MTALRLAAAAQPARGADETAFRALLQAEYSLRPQAGSGVDWHPASADMAASADLGFTTGPWRRTGAGATRQGEFLTIWIRDAAGAWHVAVDTGMSHAAQIHTDAALSQAEPNPAERGVLPKFFATEDGASHGMAGFASASAEDGLAAGLRTYGRNDGFLLLMEGEAPMELAAANRYFTHRPLSGAWEERASGRSGDATLTYCTGALFDAKHAQRRSGTQIWQYDSKVANWGLRILLLGAAASVAR